MTRRKRPYPVTRNDEPFIRLTNTGKRTWIDINRRIWMERPGVEAVPCGLCQRPTRVWYAPLGQPDKIVCPSHIALYSPDGSRYRNRPPCDNCAQPASSFALLPNAQGVYELAGNFCDECLRATAEGVEEP